MELKIIEELLREPLLASGYELISVNYLKENGVMVLRVTVDRDEPISLDDIVNVSDMVSAKLDEADPIKEQYFLDVTSLGAEKPIEPSKLEKYLTRYVRLHVTNPIDGENYLEGDLKDVNEEEVILTIRVKSRVKEVKIRRATIDKARLAIKF